MAQEWLAENINLPVEGSLRYQMEKRNIVEEQVVILSIFPPPRALIPRLGQGTETGRGGRATNSQRPTVGERI